MGQTLTSTPPVTLAETVQFCSRLIRFDTSNFGGGNARGERAAAEWVAECLSDAGYSPQVLEAAPGRASTVARIPGADRHAPALVVHGHLDVVPAEAADWLEYLTASQPTALAKERAANGRQAPYKIAILGIGNENWDCGGNMTPCCWPPASMPPRTCRFPAPGRTAWSQPSTT